MRRLNGFIASCVFAIASFAASAAEREDAPTELIVLGVDHAAQLVNRRQQPAALRAFFESIAPSAICIERSPERFARGDHYEFTYEIQDVIVPWARESGAPLHPFDWLPSPEDTSLAFGVDDLERPPLLRRPTGFQGFLSFPDERSRTAGLFFGDQAEERARHRRFYVEHPDEPRGDFARRLFLYRTFMQAARIARAARDYPGKRVLVVVGVMHKDDIERILAADRRIRIVQPSAIAREPTPADIERHQLLRDLFAIATFNLLGVQSRSAAVDLPWLEEVLRKLEASKPGPETELLATRLAELQKRISPEAALSEYSRIAERAKQSAFSWNGVKDSSRLDSFFDPFGNLTVGQRATVEMARLHHAAGRVSEADALRTSLRQSLDHPVKRAQLDGYWPEYVASVAERAAAAAFSTLPASLRQSSS